MARQLDYDAAISAPMRTSRAMKSGIESRVNEFRMGRIILIGRGDESSDGGDGEAGDDGDLVRVGWACRRAKTNGEEKNFVWVGRRKGDD